MRTSDSNFMLDERLWRLRLTHDDMQLHRLAVNGTLMVTQISGRTDMLQNMLCSLRRIDPQLVRRMVVWAYDYDTYRRLMLEQGREYTLIHDNEVPRDAHLRKSLKDDMMRYRPRFFLKVVKGLKLDLFFVDSDIVFKHDPWPWVVANRGLGVDTFGLEQHESLYHENSLAFASTPAARVEWLH